jgi:transcriptional regulator with XRE-family HTH domain
MDKTQASPFGDLLRQWRQRRRFSQLNLALDTEMSQRHLSFIESGRARPSREMVIRLAAQLELPARERNIMLLAAGFAPVHPERRFDAPDFAVAREAIELVLERHMPHPALAIDRHWNLLMANKAAAGLMAGCATHLLASPANVLRLSFSQEGLAGRILNFPEWRAHTLARLSREVEISGDATLAALLAELEVMPQPPLPVARHRPQIEENGIVVPLQLTSPAGALSFISMTSVFGTAVDVTLAEVTIETFLPADARTARIMAAETAEMA